MSAISKGCQATAQRIINAEEGFLSNVQRISGCSRVEAEKVLRIYRKMKLVKADYVGGSIQVKHGAFLDKSTLVNAINCEG